MRRLLYLFLLLTSIACGNSAKNAAAVDNEVNLKDSIIDVTINDIATDGSRYRGKMVRVKGIVDHVCRHSGSMLTMQDADHSVQLKVLASPEVQRFDPELGGSNVEVVGVCALISPKNIDECVAVENIKVDTVTNGVCVVVCKSMARLQPIPAIF